MEVSVIRCSQSKVLSTELARRELGFGGWKGHGLRALNWRSNLCFARITKWKNSRLRFSPPVAVLSELVRPKEASDSLESSDSFDRIKLFVGLPLDVISSCNTVNHTKAIAAGLKVLKLLGVEGVEVPVWWGIVEKEAIGKYDWSGYLALADMVQNAGLKLHVSLCFHGCKQLNVSLPNWVSRIGESDPGIFFTDRSGKRYKECLSLAVDDLPVLDGKTALQVYRDFCMSFKSSFLSSVGSMVAGVTVGLGPDGELRYPSHHGVAKGSTIPGAGEFQCYDQNMLSNLKQHAEANGNPLWGLGGPHNAPSYVQAPHSTNFFNVNGGSWVSPYGDFFLSWYSSQLLSHGDRVLSMATSVFEGSGLEISGQVPLAHSWFKMRSHPSEVASGFYNTCNRDGYEAVAKMFAKNSCRMVLPGMDLSDESQRVESLSSPESLVKQIGKACQKHGVEILGQNSSFSDSSGGFRRIKKNLLGEKMANSFTYQRMGVHFFSPKHFPPFTQFVKILNEPELYDPLKDDEFENQSVAAGSRSNMQAA